MLKSLYVKFRNLILYGIFGIIAAVIDYGTYVILVRFGIIAIPEAASLVGNLCGFVFTFLTNTLLNFKKKDAFFRRFVSYALICLLGSAVSTFLIYLLKDFINIYILKVGVMIIICTAQYLLNKLITYRN